MSIIYTTPHTTHTILFYNLIFTYTIKLMIFEMLLLFLRHLSTKHRL